MENPTEVTIVTGGSQSLSLTVKSDSSRYDFLAENTPEENEPVIDISFPFIDNVRKQHTKDDGQNGARLPCAGYAGASIPSDAVPGLRTGWELGISQLSGVELTQPLAPHIAHSRSGILLPTSESRQRQSPLRQRAWTDRHNARPEGTHPTAHP